MNRRERRAGIARSGNIKHREDHHRSIPLRALLPLVDCGATFVSLQKDLRPDDAATLGERADIIDLTAHLTDFSATAALLSCLDLVISVDSSIAHLAGALALPAWILLPYTGCSIAKTVPGTRRRGCSGRMRPATIGA